MNLKTYYDAAITAETAVQAVLSEMDTLLTEGKKAEALDLRPKLDEAKTQAKEANEIYSMMRDGAEASGKARNFVPAGGKEAEKAAANQTSRAVFDQMEAKDQMKFVKSGGIVVDDEE